MEDNTSDHSSDVIIVSVDKKFKNQKTLCQKCYRKKKQKRIKQKCEIRREITLTRIVLNSKVTETFPKKEEKRHSKAESKDRIVPICYRNRCRGCFSNKSPKQKDCKEEEVEEKNTIQVKIFNKRPIPSEIKTKRYNKANRKDNDLRKLLNDKYQKYDDLRIYLNNRYCKSSRKKNPRCNEKDLLASSNTKKNILDLEEIDSSEPYEDISSGSFGTYVNDDLDALIKRTKEREKKNLTDSTLQEIVFDKEDKDVVQHVGIKTQNNITGQNNLIVLNDTEKVSEISLPVLKLKQDNSLIEHDKIGHQKINVSPHFKIHLNKTNKVSDNSNLKYCITNEEHKTNNLDALNNSCSNDIQPCQLQHYNPQTYLQDYENQETCEYNYDNYINCVKCMAGYNSNDINGNYQQIRTWTANNNNFEIGTSRIENSDYNNHRFGTNPGVSEYYCNENNTSINYNVAERRFEFYEGLENVQVSLPRI